ncbi:Hypothetical protein DPCES_1629 [Desulfitobacterium hafniense]|uniref:Uncharacterized protein n=1 Tax=Desulfitobacterium hafniense TaxID=49338 RepID=A0A098B0X2_DESHA|nr:hypothetical protein [Desulfitobacterium hafniense]CDX01516.1 Hypothetical protein DPCES_1629 [Desulfitobacterium hafniense]
MDDIKFIGYCPDGQFKMALKNRKNPMELETFFTAVNQAAAGGCGCCKQDAKVYAVYPAGLHQIKPDVLSICAECLKSLPTELDVINIDSNNAPPALIHSWREV